MMSGHGEYHQQFSIVSPNAYLIYATIETLGAPLLMHVNGLLYEDELRTVLTRFPKMRVLCPHFCLFAQRIERLHGLMEDFPNLYSDPSFGRFMIMQAGVRHVQKHRKEIRIVMRHHKDRFLFGTDLPPTPEEEPELGAGMAQGYRDMLEKEDYTLLHAKFKGLGLDPCTLNMIYRSNAEAFLARE